MAATSVTGVSGPGSAQGHGKGNKGSEHMSLAVHRLIGPRVVICGDLQLDEGGAGTFFFPELPGGPSLYCPFLSTSPPSAGVHAWFDNFTSSSVDITGGNGQNVCVQIVKKGLWGSLENNGPAENIANT